MVICKFLSLLSRSSFWQEGERFSSNKLGGWDGMGLVGKRHTLRCLSPQLARLVSSSKTKKIKAFLGTFLALFLDTYLTLFWTLVFETVGTVSALVFSFLSLMCGNIYLVRKV